MRLAEQLPRGRDVPQVGNAGSVAVPALLEFTRLSGKGYQEILAQLRIWDLGRQ